MPETTRFPVAVTQTTQLTAPEVQAALRIAGVAPVAASPFAGLAPPGQLDAGAVASLRRKQIVNGSGTLVDSWRSALIVLADPTHRAALFLGSPDRWFAIDYYASSSGLVGYSSDAGAYNVTFPCTTETLEQPLAEWLRWPEMSDVAASQFELQTAELAALAAVVDASREETLRAIVERRQANVTRFSREQLVYQLEAASQSDPRWLCALLRGHAARAFVPVVDALNAGAQILANRGWLRFEGSDAVVEAPLQAMSLSMANINPYAVLGMQVDGGVGGAVIVMCGLRSYWAVEFLAGDRARLSELGGPAVGDLLAGYLKLLPARTAPSRWEVPAPAQAPFTARRQPTPPPVPPPVPAAATVPAAGHCPRCGKPLQPGRVFCTGCGAAVT